MGFRPCKGLCKRDEEGIPDIVKCFHARPDERGHKHDQRLRPGEHLRRSSDFQRAFRQGRKHVTAFFVVYAVRNSLSYSRYGLAVSRRVGKAVVRNLLKRRLREVFRQHKSVLDPPVDIVVVVRREAAQVSGQMFTQQFVSVLHHWQAVRPATTGTELPTAHEEHS